MEILLNKKRALSVGNFAEQEKDIVSWKFALKKDKDQGRFSEFDRKNFEE